MVLILKLLSFCMIIHKITGYKPPPIKNIKAIALSLL